MLDSSAVVVPKKAKTTNKQPKLKSLPIASTLTDPALHVGQPKGKMVTETQETV